MKKFSVIVLGYTKDIFAKEILAHPEFKFVSMDEAKELRDLERHIHDSPAMADKYQNLRNQYIRRLSKREVNGIYRFYGYRQFANRVINVEDIQVMLRKQGAEDLNEFDPVLVKKWIESGNVRVNTAFIESLSRSLIICDEVHNLYSKEILNTYGLAVQLVLDHFFKVLPENDINYRSVRMLMLSATPLTSSPLEIIPIVALLTGEAIAYNSLFRISHGVELITPAGKSKIRQSIAGRISYVMDDNPKEYPSTSFEGDVIKGIDFLRFVRSKPINHQLRCLKHWNQRHINTDEKGTTLIKDIALPATEEYPHGVVFSRNIPDFASLHKETSVIRVSDGRFTSQIFELKNLINYSSKFTKLVKLCIKMKGKEFGKMFIYHPFVQGSGVDMLVSILCCNGFLLEGDHPMDNSLCMHCDETFGTHKQGSHSFTPVVLTFITGSLSKVTLAARINAFNSDDNVFGERVKIIIGSRAMRESHSLKACKHVIITHDPSSVSELIQIVGRAVRKRVHSMLPPDMRKVAIHILTTNVEGISQAEDDPSSNEELAYLQKVLFYKQIDIIERIMYDVSIDYLINFRLKLRETPPLIGNPFTLDKQLHSKYAKVLTKAYADIRNGTTPSGIHTNRFNVFYFNGEVRIVMIIIKRILLDHQLVITFEQIRALVRNPPFTVEYNTQLISDEFIAVAISRLVFRPDQLRLIVPWVNPDVVDTLYDQSSTLIDTDHREYKIVCIGDLMCESSYLTKRLTSSIIQGDNSYIDAYRNVYAAPIQAPIDLADLASTWASTIDINDVLSEIKSVIHSDKKLSEMFNKLPMKSHCMLADWAIKLVADNTFSKIISDDLVVCIIGFYQAKKMLFTIHELRSTRIYNRYKHYDVDTGSGWNSSSAKPSTATLPIGHVISQSVRVYQPFDKTWLELSSIGTGVQGKHPYGFYIYEERTKDTLNVVLKIMFEDDPKAKGITMAFLQRTDLERVADKLKLDVSLSTKKSEIIEKIEPRAWMIQEGLYPERVIYQLIDM